MPYHWDYDEMVRKICDTFDIKRYEIYYLEPYRNYFKVNLDDNFVSLTGERLARKIWNEYGNVLFKGKYFGTLSTTDKPIHHPCIIYKKLKNGKYVNHYHSRIILEGDDETNFPFQPIYDFLNKPEEGVNIIDLINRCFHEICKAYESDYEYWMSDECITSEIRENDLKFLEDGKIFIY